MLRVRGSGRRKLFRRLRRQGWVVTHGGDHFHARSPEGRLVVLCSSPSLQRDWQEDLAYLKRHGFKEFDKKGRV
jgi:hypothetical protein